MKREVIVLDADVALALSNLIHRAEQSGFNLTEMEDDMWGYLTQAINQKVTV
jgi:hypothetical protein